MLAGLSAVGIGLLAVFGVLIAVWVFAAHGDDNTAAVVRACGSVWLGLHLVPMTVGGNPLGLLPWLFMAVPAWSVWRAVRWSLESARPTAPYEHVLLVGYVTLTYATVALVISMFSSTTDLYTSDALAVVRTMAVALPVATGCLWRHGRLSVAVPELVREACRAGFAAAALLYSAGAALVTAALVLHMEQVRSVTALMAPDALDGLFLTALGIGYVPTAAAWGMAYLIGPGVALGAGAVVSVTTTSPGRLPAFPLLAMLPAQTPRFAALFVLVLVVAGALMYSRIPRLPWQAAAPVSLVRAPELAATAVATVALGAVVAVVCAASSGAVGRDLLSDVGPHAVAVTLKAMAVAGGTCLGLLLVPRLMLVALARSTAAQRS